MAINLESPPGFVLTNDLLKAADDLGFRIDEGLHGAWLKRASTTARGSIFLGGESSRGPWFLGIENEAIVAELKSAHLELGDFDRECFRFESLNDLRAGIDQAYRLGVSLPNAPLEAFLEAIERKPQNTEAERLAVQRIGQSHFRRALLDYWGGRCCVTGIRDSDLLRASHIKPWALCDSDTERLDVHNGLLLSALWDAAFDKGLVTFDENMQARFSSNLSDAAHLLLTQTETQSLDGMTPYHAEYLNWHRENLFVQV